MSDRDRAIGEARARMQMKGAAEMAASKDAIRAAPTAEQGVPGMVMSGMGIFGGGTGGLPDWGYFVDDREYAAELAWPAGVEKYERMETSDAQVKGLMLATTMPPRRFRWEIDPNEARPEAVDLAAEDLNLPVRGEDERRVNRRGFNHDRHMGHSLRALGQGHYHFEEVVELRGDGLLHLKKLGTRPPRSIVGIRTDDHGDLEAIEQMSGGLPTSGRILGGLRGLGVRVLEANRLLTYLWDTADDGDQVGRSILRAVYRNWLVKDALIRVDAVKHERNAMGVPWFEVDPAASKDQIESLARRAEEIRASSVGGGAGPGKLRIAGVEGSLPDTIGSVRYHDEQMAKALMLLLYNLGGDAASGARALGDTFMDWYLHFQGAIADWYAEMTQAFIDRQVERNFGPDEQSPLLTYTRTETAELAFSDFALGVKEGLILPGPELSAYIEERFKVPGQKLAAEEKADEPAPTPPPAPAVDPEGEPAAEPVAAGETVPRPQPRRSALAEKMAATLTTSLTWPQLARAVGSDPKNGTARRARDLLLREGAIVEAKLGNGTRCLASGTNAAPNLGTRPASERPRLTSRERWDVFQRDSFKCRECGSSDYPLHVDHVVPRAAGGADEQGNYQTLCGTCNIRKGTTIPAASGLTLPDRDLKRAPLAFEVTAQVNFSAMDDAFEQGRATLVGAYRAAQSAQVDQLVAAVAAAEGNAATLAALECDPVDVGVLVDPMLAIAEQGVASAQAEHEAQIGVQAKAAFTGAEADTEALEATVRERAEAASLTLASGLSTSASKKAAAVSALEPEAAATAVREHLTSLSDAALDEQLGGATQQSYNSGRRAYFRAAGPREVYASEILDRNTCTACNGIDGTEWPTLAEAEGSYPIGGYLECEGGLRCRGTLVAVY